MDENNGAKNQTKPATGSISEDREKGQEHDGAGDQKQANSKTGLWKRLATMEIIARAIRTWKTLNTFEKVSAAIQVVSAIAIILYTGFSCFQWKEMHRLNNITGQSFMQSARARVRVERFESFGNTNIWDFGRAETWNGMFAPIVVTIKNTGNSDAIVSVRWKLMFTNVFDTVGVLIAEGEAKAEGVVYPTRPKCDDLASLLDVSKPIDKGGTTEITLAFGEQLRGQQIKAFESGKLKVNLVGCIHSRDEIGEIHRTRICAFLQPLSVAVGFINYQSTHNLAKQDWTPCNDNNLEDGLITAITP